MKNGCNYRIETKLILFSFLFLIISCDFNIDTVMTETNQINSIASANSECDLVETMNYNLVNGKRKILSLRLVGCEFEYAQDEVEKIHKALKDSLYYFCDIKMINYNIINKGNSQVFKYYECNPI